MVSGQQDDIGALLLGDADVGSAFDAEFFGLVRGCDAHRGVGHCGDNGNGFSAQFGVELLLDGRKIAVEVEEHRSQGKLTSG